MLVNSYRIVEHNSPYEGIYSERERYWKEICAVEKTSNIFELLPDGDLDNVLEVGCGDGAVIAKVAGTGKFRDHVGIDIVDPNLNASKPARNLRMMQYDGSRVPFEDKAFDLVYASHVIEHVPEPRTLLREMKRVARKWVYVEVPCEIHFRTSRQALQSTLDIGHINCYTPDAFMILLQTADLEVKEIKAFDHSFEVHRFNTSAARATIKMALRQAALKLSPTLATKLFTFHCGALCRV